MTCVGWCLGRGDDDASDDENEFRDDSSEVYANADGTPVDATGVMAKRPKTKERYWKYPPENDMCYAAHNAIRGELVKMERALEHCGETPCQGWRAKCFKAYFDGHREHVTAHHTTENNEFAPWMRTRFELPDKFTEDHSALEERVKALREAFDALKEGDVVVDVLKLWREYRTEMEAHLEEEQDIIVPLLRQHFKPAEASSAIMGIMSRAGTKIELGAFVHHLKNQKTVRELMSEQGIPGLAWRFSLKPARNQYREKMETQIQQMLSDTPVLKKPYKKKKELELAMNVDDWQYAVPRRSASDKK